LNKNGVRDPNEPAVPGQRWVGLAYRTAKGYTAVNPGCCMSQADGRYEFSGLAAGEYMVGLVDISAPTINPPAGPNRIPELPVVLADGERRTGVDFGFALQPGGPTPEIVPTAEPTPIVLTPALEPAAPLSTLPPVGPPMTGTGGASPDGSLAGFASALALAGALAVGASVLVGRRRRARFRR
jgi:hypothetical protein